MDLQRRIDRGAGWMVVGALDVVTLILLLRFWVTPEQLGIATLAVSLFPVLDVLGDVGLPASLVQRREQDERVLSTVFWLNLAVAAVLLGLLGLLAPLLGRFHGHPVVGSLLIAYGLKLVIQVGTAVPIALLRQELRFREVALLRMGANLGDVTTKLVLAALGFPIWCFVGGQIGSIVVLLASLGVVRPWRPRLVFDRSAAGACLSFGGRTSVNTLLTQFFTNIDYQIVGHFFGASSLAIYRVAMNLVLYPVQFISGVTVDVAFPSFARLRLDPPALAAQFLRFARQNLWFTLPVVVLILAGANDLLTLFFPDYVAGASAARILCLVGLLRAMSLIWAPLLNGIGRPGDTLFYSVSASIVMPVIFVLAAVALGDRFGIVSVALGWAVGYPIAVTLLASAGLRRVSMPWRRYVGAVAPLFAVALAALLAGLLVVRAAADWSPAPRLAAVAAVCGLIFFAMRANIGRRRPDAGSSP